MAVAAEAGVPGVWIRMAEIEPPKIEAPPPIEPPTVDAPPKKSVWKRLGEWTGLMPRVEETRQPSSIMSGSRVKLPFGLELPPRTKTTPGVPPIEPVEAPRGRLRETFDRYERLERSERSVESSATSEGTGGVTSPITVNITFNGAVDREETKAGVMEGLEEMLERLNHEKSRRAYA